MNANEIKERIEKLERWCWFEQMADFMNWTAYDKAQTEIKELKKKLEEILKKGLTTENQQCIMKSQKEKKRR